MEEAQYCKSKKIQSDLNIPLYISKIDNKDTFRMGIAQAKNQEFSPIWPCEEGMKFIEFSFL